VRATLQRLPLERAVVVAVPVTIFAFLCGTASVDAVYDVGRLVRWLALLGLLGLAALAAFAREDRPALPLAPVIAAGLFLELALLSAAWSLDPRLSLGRAASLAILFAAVALVAYSVAGRGPAVVSTLASVAAGAGLAAAAGLVVLALRPDDATIDATVEYPARFQGLGANPNTVAALIALTLPCALLVLLRARSTRGRIAAGALLLLLVGSLVASASRGALLAGLAAVLVLALLGLNGWRARLAVAGTALAAFVLGTAVIELQDPLSPPPPARSAGNETVQLPRYLDAEVYRRLEDDIGHPGFRKTGAVERRTLFGSSGRAQAWEGALEEGAKRPVAGYGFGVEAKAFTDRYVAFQGNLPENSYIGVFLQLGAAGLVLFLAVFALLLLGAARAFRRLGPETRLVTAACAAVVVGGLVLGLAQSYLYSVGNVATLPVWLCAFLLAAATRS
jgi:O-antigen ligase